MVRGAAWLCGGQGKSEREVGVALSPPASLAARLGKPLDQKAGQRINSFMAKGKDKAKGFPKESDRSYVGKEMGNSAVGAGGGTRQCWGSPLH